MEAINQDNVRIFNDRFGFFDGACIQTLSFHYPTKKEPSLVDLYITAYDNLAQERCIKETDPPNKWVSIQIRIENIKEFRIYEGPKNSNVQPDDHLEIQWINGMVYLIFDPLQSKDFKKSEWTIKEVQSSNFYFCGKHCFWQIIT